MNANECPTCGVSGTRRMKFRVEDSDDFVICEACHPAEVSLPVEVGAESPVTVTGRLDWSKDNPLVDWGQGTEQPLHERQRPWYAQLARAFSHIFHPSGEVSEPDPLA